MRHSNGGKMHGGKTILVGLLHMEDGSLRKISTCMSRWEELEKNAIWADPEEDGEKGLR